MAGISYEVVQDDIGLMSNAALCIKHKLYVAGWNLSEDLTFIKNGIRLADKCLAIAKDGETPIGVCLKDRGFIQVFVRKSYRYQGIGSTLIERIKATPDEKLSAGME